jgi:hypothetical protein
VNTQPEVGETAQGRHGFRPHFRAFWGIELVKVAVDQQWAK